MSEKQNDLFSDHDIANWKMLLCAFYGCSDTDASDFVAAARGPVSQLASAINCSHMWMARSITRVVYG